ncbi:MobC family plasmid mobilization relaxosome protein [Nocardia gipuzkoensis]|uniref:MobC family plasmid mobilization relaxosome protein n=1 Tax=Nocardia gipuzkoensis TaxID=2749991 RepID=UPI0015EF0278|nr:MobC family plasmid mobilization relaxosome protein [Nocardia gipuzkoensis]
MVTQVPERPDSAAHGAATPHAGVPSKRRMQSVARTRNRKRQENIGEGAKRFRVTVSAADAVKLVEAAAEANMTVPRFLAESAMNPTGGRRRGGRRSGSTLAGGGPDRVGDAGKADEADEVGPWLPWPKRKTLAGVLLSAAGAMDEVRVEHLAKIGGNLNQIAHAANITGTLAEEFEEVLAEHRALMADLAERAARMDELAREVTRR